MTSVPSASARIVGVNCLDRPRTFGIRELLEGQSMRMITILAAGTALALATAANAQAPSMQQAPSRPPAASPQAPSAAPAIQSVNVVDIDEVPAATQSQVNEMVTKRGEAELGKLRDSIEAAPAIRSALEAKGLTSRNVIIAQLNQDGALTLVAKKTG
jgi:hypothetical protein